MRERVTYRDVGGSNSSFSGSSYSTSIGSCPGSGSDSVGGSSGGGSVSSSGG